MDWTKCLFCKKLSHKKVKYLINVSTFEVCNTIYSAADSIGDDDMLLILNGVSNDLVAAEAKYHKACLASYVSQKNVNVKAFKEAKQEDVFAASFHELVVAIQPGIDAGKAYTMNSLLQKYKALLEAKSVPAHSYASQRMKLRLKNHFGNTLVFHQPYDRTKPEFVYSALVSLQDVINAASRQVASDKDACESSAQSEERELLSLPTDRKAILYRAAMMLKSDIKELTGISIQPLNSNDLTNESAKQMIPESLYWMLRWIISSSGKEETGEFESPECKTYTHDRAGYCIHCLTW